MLTPRQPIVFPAVYREPSSSIQDAAGGPRIVPSDDELLARIRCGQGHVFDVLVARYGSRLHGFVTHLVGDRDTADDVVQEVFVRVLLRAHERDPNIRFAVWLFCVARRVALDLIRRRRIQDRVMNFVKRGFGRAFETMSPSTAVEMSEFEIALRGALEAIPEDQREVFLLREREGLSYEEIAEVVGVPAKTVSTRLTRARARLRELLADHLSPDREEEES